MAVWARKEREKCGEGRARAAGDKDQAAALALFLHLSRCQSAEIRIEEETTIFFCEMHGYTEEIPPAPRPPWLATRAHLCITRPPSATIGTTIMLSC